MNPLVAAAAARPDAPFLIDAHGTSSFAESSEAVARLVPVLAPLEGQVVLVSAAESTALAHLLFAGAEAGVTLALAPPGASRGQLEALRAAVKAAEVITTPPRPAARPAAARDAWRAPLVLFSSGTSGVQRPVAQRWSTLLARAAVRDRLRGARWALAFRLNHFAGVQVLVHAVANLGTLVVPEALTPEAVRRALEAHAATHVSATPTFWRLYAAVHASAAPLEGVLQVTLGGEAATEAVLQALRLQFPKAALTHVYATTELGSCFSVSDGRAGFPAAWLSDGARRTGLRLVDGELQVRRHDEGPEAPWLPTGDAVAQVGDRCVFRGRLVETINVGGVKVSPLEVEEAVAGVTGVLHARAWGKANPVTGQLVALSVVLAPGAPREAVERAVREAVQGLPRVRQPRVIEFVDQLEEVNLKLARRAPREPQ